MDSGATEIASLNRVPVRLWHEGKQRPAREPFVPEPNRDCKRISDADSVVLKIALVCCYLG